MKNLIVWEGPSPWNGQPIVAILTGLARPSQNSKTGKMVQLWILHADLHPLEALASGDDEAICGDCPLRGVRGKQRTCYVDVGKAPSSTWRAYKRGSHVRVSPHTAARLLEGRRVRLGAYGDPTMLPIDVVETLISKADGWTGYTHQWANCDQQWRNMLMASADSVNLRRIARELGWRSFVLANNRPDGAFLCPSVASGRQCFDCLACGGTRFGAVAEAQDVYIPAHGPGAKYLDLLDLVTV